MPVPPVSNGTIFDRIRARRAEMTPGYERVADWLVEHPKDAAFASAAEVADAVGASESLVVRFAAFLGYEGFPGLSRELQAIVKAHLSLPERLDRAPPELTSHTTMPDVFAHVVGLDRANLAETLDDPSSSALEDVLAALLEARTIYLVGLRGSAHLAGLFGLLLDKVGANVRVVTQGDLVLFDRIRTIGSEDALFAFAFPRYTRRSAEALRIARQRGAATIVMTDAPSSPMAGEAALSLHVRVASASFQHSYVAAVSVLNTLVVGWTLRAHERTVASLDALEDLLPNDAFLR